MDEATPTALRESVATKALGLVALKGKPMPLEVLALAKQR